MTKSSYWNRIIATSAAWLALILFLSVLSIASSAFAFPAECEVPQGFIGLAKCIGSDTAKTVVIGGPNGTGECNGGNRNAYVSQASIAMGRITINAGSTLKVFDRTAQLPINVQTTGIDVFGTLEIGSPACPIGTINPGTVVKFTFKGPKDPTCTNNSCPGYTKGIQVEKGATLQMFGAKGAPPKGVSWTNLSDAAGPTTYDAAHRVKVPAKSATQIIVDDDVMVKPNAWQPNDWIAVGGTGYSPFETEFVQILSFGALTPAGDRIVNLSPFTPLKFYHFGSPAPTKGTSPTCKDKGGNLVPASFCDPAAKNFGVDERAEVGLISRNIKLTADTPATGPDNHWGGETKFLPGFTEVSLQGVEIEKFGKEKLGSYPIHFHMDGDLLKVGSKVLLDANSVHHSYNKCITVHSTSNLTITNNVCARVTGHIFYEEIGDEDNITFTHNLGLGAMSNSFDVNDSFNSTTNTGFKRDALIKSYWWIGDNMVDPLNLAGNKLPFDAFRIKDLDDQSNGTAGQCFKFGNPASPDNGSFIPSTKPVPPCQIATDYYIEPASGFWIVNPSAKLHNNSIGGCQGEGKGYWYVPPARGPLGIKKFIPVGTYAGIGDPHGEFVDNRVHGCDSGLYSGDQQDITAEALQPYQKGVKSPTSRPVMGEFNGVIATRNRNRGLWLRPNFYTVTDARLATNRDSVSLVTSGGPDGNYPGIYSLFNDAVVVGVSQNNVDRFGPCPGIRNIDGFSQAGGGRFGCIDKTVAKQNTLGTGGDLIGNGYPDNRWNFAGYMIYDGPALIFHDRFVNFKVDPTNLLTTTDAAYLNSPPPPTPPPPAGVYQGDAALGWFQGNQSSYPVATASKDLVWDGSDFRHQVYTDKVKISGFLDGDKNTAIIDLDGTLSRYTVKSFDPKLAGHLHPISLNNLEINAAGGDPGGSVDECQATGKQDTKLEGRANANFSPGVVGALEFEALFPNPPPPDATVDDKRHEQQITFTKDSTEFSGTLQQHPEFVLDGRDAQGIWEPKVHSGYGYTITASAGIPTTVHVGLADVVKPNITKDTPFFVRVGICYQGTGPNTVNGHPKEGAFTVTQGYRSWGGGGVEPDDQLIRTAYNELNGQANGLTKTEACFNIDHQNYAKNKNCPSVGIYPMLNNVCPAAADKEDPARKLCIYSKQPVEEVEDTCTNPSCLIESGKPVLNKYFYDPTTGWLFFNVAQIRPNALGPAPLGACTGKATDPYFCPSKTGGESYYVCPAEGCFSYGITLNDPSWVPAPSKCPDPYVKYGSSPTPALDGKLVAITDGSDVTRITNGGKDGKFPHYNPATEPKDCITPK